MVKNPLANAGDIKDAGLIPGLGRSPGERHGNPLQYFAWRSPWTEELGGLQSIGSQSDMIEATYQACATHNSPFSNPAGRSLRQGN